MSDKTGGPAFPVLEDIRFNADWRSEFGMSMRDYFAAKAMQGLMDAAMPMSEIAKEAYIMADLMIAERDK
jgi:hypothetical protein